MTDVHGATVMDLSSAGQVLSGRYELLGLLGSGGMGNVYRARDRELDELVALKVLQPASGDDEAQLTRFRREVKLARRVTHPNVARMFDIGEHEGLRLLTMELVDGESLGARLRRSRLSLDEALAMARMICAGVGAAHAAGVIHRDLKPDNVLLSRADGRVVVTDFGIARAHADPGRTAGFIGTPAYMAPEQVDGSVPIDHRADIYGFGAMLFEMLVGAPAWDGPSLWAIASARLSQPPPDPRLKRPDLPPALAELVMRCMARDREARPSTMADVEAALTERVEPHAATVLAPGSHPTPRPPVATPTMPGQRLVAVLPFANLGPADQDYVADGLTEDLIDTLSMARDMRVRSRGVVMPYKGQTLDPRVVGSELEVQVVVEGSVRPAGSAYRINVRLISVADGFQLWAQRFDVPADQLLVYNDRIAARVAEALSRDLDGPARQQPTAPGSVDLYLRARHAYHTAFTDSGAAATRLFRELLAMTPNDPRALAGCAMAESGQWFWADGKRDELLAMADRAIALEPRLPEGFIARAAVLAFDGDPADAMRSAREAHRLAPHNAQARELLGRLLQLCDRAECEAHLEAAIALEPTFELPYLQLFDRYALAGQRERAQDVVARMRAHGVPSAAILEARDALWFRDVARAREVRLRLDPNNRQHAEVLHWLAALIDGTPPPVGANPSPPNMSVPAFLQRFFVEIETELACILDDLPGAEEALGRLDEMGGWNLPWLRRCPLLEPLRERAGGAAIQQRFEERAAAVAAAFDA